MAVRSDKVARVEVDGVTLVEGRTPDVRFAFTERTGGVSEAPYASLNLGIHVGDDPFAVHENRRRVLEALGAADCEHNLLVPNQVHGDTIVTVTKNGADYLESVREKMPRRFRDRAFLLEGHVRPYRWQDRSSDVPGYGLRSHSGLRVYRSAHLGRRVRGLFRIDR